MNEWIHRVFIIINIIIVIIIITEDLYWSDLTKLLFHKNTHFILLNAKIKMSQWVRLYETITLEYLVEHLQQCLGNCIKPKLCRLAQSWAATSWDVSVHVWPRGAHSRRGASAAPSPSLRASGCRGLAERCWLSCRAGPLAQPPLETLAGGTLALFLVHWQTNILLLKSNHCYSVFGF